MPTVFDAQGQAYSAVQLTTASQIGVRHIPAGWWIVTDGQGQRSPVEPTSFDRMFTPVQGVYNLGTPGGAAQLDHNAQITNRLAYEAAALGVATLDSNATLVQTTGLVLYDAQGRVILGGRGTLTVPAQTGSAVSNGIPNLAVGWLAIPAGTASGGYFTVSNAACTIRSLVFLQLSSYNTPAILDVTGKRAGSFDVQITTINGSAIAAAEAVFLIIN